MSFTLCSIYLYYYINHKCLQSCSTILKLMGFRPATAQPFHVKDVVTQGEALAMRAAEEMFVDPRGAFNGK